MLELIGLGICLAVVYWFWKKTNLPEYDANAHWAEKPEDRPASSGASNAEAVDGADDLRIENVEQGAVIQLSHIGAGMEDFDVEVLSRHVYRQGECTWYELECDRDGERVWIDMEQDDVLDLAIALRQLQLHELALTHDDLLKMDEAENGFLTHDGVDYFLEDSDGAVFYRDGEDHSAEEFYYWDFVSKDRQHRIGIEEWRDGSIDITYSEALQHDQISVFSLRGQKDA